jgi:threonine/homoserine/homoserine lactone efflux protein
MKDTDFLAFIIGFFSASPVGPMGLLCMRRVLLRGFTSGILSALGISCASSFWAYVAIHGLASFSFWIEREQQPLEIAIGLFFFLYGLHAMFNSPRTEYPTLEKKGKFSEFFSTFLVVFLNPATFMSFTALFTLFGIGKRYYGLFDSIEIGLSVFVGAMTYWIATSFLILKIKNKIGDSIFKQISWISAIGIMAFGMTILVNAI